MIQFRYFDIEFNVVFIEFCEFEFQEGVVFVFEVIHFGLELLD